MNSLARLDHRKMGNTSDSPNQTAIGLSVLIEKACEIVISRALRSCHIIPRRLFNPDEAPLYLSVSDEEIHRLISAKQRRPVRHGRRVRVDVHDLEAWILIHKERNLVKGSFLESEHVMALLFEPFQQRLGGLQKLIRLGLCFFRHHCSDNTGCDMKKQTQNNDDKLTKLPFLFRFCPALSRRATRDVFSLACRQLLGSPSATGFSTRLLLGGSHSGSGAGSQRAHHPFEYGQRLRVIERVGWRGSRSERHRFGARMLLFKKLYRLLYDALRALLESARKSIDLRYHPGRQIVERFSVAIGHSAQSLTIFLMHTLRIGLIMIIKHAKLNLIEAASAETDFGDLSMCVTCPGSLKRFLVPQTTTAQGFQGVCFE